MNVDVDRVAREPVGSELRQQLAGVLDGVAIVREAERMSQQGKRAGRWLGTLRERRRTVPLRQARPVRTEDEGNMGVGRHG